MVCHVLRKSNRQRMAGIANLWVRFSESKVTRCTKLKNRLAMRTSFANRLVDMFLHYVSAFTNCVRGDVYVVIYVKGKLEGQFLTEDEKDSEGNVIPSWYVVVVSIAQCRGGVFTEQPKCYKIANGDRVQIVGFASRKKTIDPRLTEEG